ncbi:MAG: SecD/SecF family protein translocase subunit [Clostridia bacterium]|nr:SecD/SecF family protein translocase subunit [Clostridia bacterium]
MAKNRRKKISIANFIIIAILTAIGLVLSVCSFDIPYTSYTYNGFAKSISLGLDLAGGISVVYDCSTENSSADLDQAIDATVTRLTTIITKEYSEATITRQGEKRIRIEVPSVTDSDKIFELIGDPMPLHMTLEQSSSAEVYIEGTDIKDVQVAYQKDDSGEYKYGVSVKFTDEGAKKFATLTDSASKKESEKYIYIYFGDVDDSADLTLTCEQKITGGSTFISGSFETYDDAKAYALQIMSGSFSAKLDLLESSVISATLGAKALKLAIIGGLVGLALIMILLFVRYGDFGLLASFALVMYTILMLFFLQAISFVQLTLPGLAGIILSIGMAVDGTVIIFERFREEYRSGKKIPLASRIGFKRAFWPIFDSNITTIMTAIVLYILGTASIQGFAITLLIGIVLSMFMNLVILRILVKWYLPINSINAKKLHLPKQLRAYKEPSEVVVGGDANE